MRTKRVYLACFLTHFFLVTVVCSRDTCALLAEGYTFSPSWLEKYWRKAEAVTSGLLGEQLPPLNPLRQGLAVYIHGAGIQSGYGFFAPNVPNNYKVVFELHHSDGQIEYALPRIGSEAAGLRLGTLLENIAPDHDGALRVDVLKMLAYDTWREHQDVTSIRAVFGMVNLPTAAEFALGQEESYQFLYAYEFTFGSDRSEPRKP